jgi:hypothetical protein
MYDANLLFTSASAITTDGVSTNLAVYKTPAAGLWVQIDVTAVSGTSPTLDVSVLEKDGTSIAATDQKVVVFPQITAVGSYRRLVQSKKSHLALYYDVGGTTPSFTLTSGIKEAVPAWGVS